MGKQKGFTIVELLIVVVVIAILAAITIVSYNGITNSANDSAVKTNLSDMSQKLQTDAVTDTSAYCETSFDTGDASCLNNSKTFTSMATGAYAASTDAMRYDYSSYDNSVEFAARSKSGHYFKIDNGTLSEISASDYSTIGSCWWGTWSSTTNTWSMSSEPC